MVALLSVIYLLAFAVHIIAVTSATRLVTTDRISENFRRAIDDKFGTNSTISGLFWCDWCVATWMAIILSATTAVLAVQFAGIPVLAAILAYPHLVLSSRYVGAWILVRLEKSPIDSGMEA